MKDFLKNFTYTFVSNILVLCITTAVTFIVPKVMGVEEYGYFQLYNFYVLYTGFLHFGWVDGIYLRYGGEYYEKLNFSKFCAQFFLFLSFEIVVAFFIGIGGQAFISVYEKKIIYLCLAFCIILYLPRTFLQSVLQCTNRMKEYALINIIEKVFYLSLVIVAILYFRKTSFLSLIVADLVGKMLALFYAIYQCKELIFVKKEKFKNTINEAILNIKVGINLMFSSIAGMLLNGVVRISIEKKWDVSTFGKVSLTMSISNMLMVVIRAISLIMFPMLKRTDNSKLTSLYYVSRTLLMLPLFLMLGLYYPAKMILVYWLPNYADGLKYMALLFPICIFESKMSMLIETYMKTLRMEKILLKINILVLILSLLLTSFIVFYLGNLDLAIFSILCLIAFRCILAEMELSKKLDICVKRDILLEVFVTMAFIVTSWFIGGVEGLISYFLIYAIYLILKRHDIIMLKKMFLLKKI